MELSDQELEQLEQYHTGRLRDPEYSALEGRLNTDTDFNREARLFLSGLSALEGGKIGTHRRYIDGMRSAEMRASPYKRWWPAIAAVLAGLLVGVWWMGREEQTITESPIAQFARQEFNPPLSIERTMQISNEAVAAYDNKEYKRAIPLLKKAFEINRDSLKMFYLSMCYIAENQPDEAIPILEKMYNERSQKAKDPAWYLALAWLMKNRPEKAKPYLEQSTQSIDPAIREKAERAILFIDQQH